MRRFVLSVSMIVMVALLISLSFEVRAQNIQTKTEVIKTDQCVRVIGWSQGCVTFKANTALETTLNNKEAVSGTLATNACLRAWGWSDGCAVYKAGTVIKFQERGGVITGTLAQDSNLRPVGMSTARTYKAGHTVTFNKDGQVVRETN